MCKNAFFFFWNLQGKHTQKVLNYKTIFTDIFQLIQSQLSPYACTLYGLILVIEVSVSETHSYEWLVYLSGIHVYLCIY